MTDGHLTPDQDGTSFGGLRRTSSLRDSFRRKISVFNRRKFSNVHHETLDQTESSVTPSFVTATMLDSYYYLIFQDKLRGQMRHGRPTRENSETEGEVDSVYLAI